MRWNVITWKNGKRKNHYLTTKDNVTADDVAFAFSIKHCGVEGEVLEIVPEENNDTTLIK